MNKKAFPHAISTVVVLCLLGIICAFLIVSALDAEETAFYVDQNGHVQSYSLYNRGYLVMLNQTVHPVCNGTISGSIYYNGTDFEKCLGTNWEILDSGLQINYYSNISYLQGENTTIWNTLWGLNTNDTKLNESIERRYITNQYLNTTSDVTHNNLYITKKIGINTINPNASLNIGNTENITNIGDKFYINGTNGKVVISSNANKIPISSNINLLHIAASDSQDAGLILDTWSATPNFNFRKAMGSASRPGAVTIGQSLGQFGWYGYKNTSYLTAPTAKMSAIASENWNDTSTPTEIRFYTTQSGATGNSLRMMLSKDGYLTFGGTTSAKALLDVRNTTGGEIIAGRIDTSVTANDLLGRIIFYAADTSTTTNFKAVEIEAQAVNTVTTNINPGRLIFRTTPINVSSPPLEVFRITEKQYLGINSSNPLARFEVRGNNEQLINFSENTTERFVINSQGYIGIKDSSPSTTFQVNATIETNETIRLTNLTGASNAYACIKANGEIYRSATACV